MALSFGRLIGLAYTLGTSMLLLFCSYRLAIASTLAIGFGSTTIVYCVAVDWFVTDTPFSLSLPEGLMHGVTVCIAFLIGHFLSPPWLVRSPSNE